MARRKRVLLAGYPHHIVQRGHDRGEIFLHDGVRRAYLQTLKELKADLGCKLYAYVLMSNHVHLLLDPGDTPGNISSFMKILSGKQTNTINGHFGRSGTLWEGRFRSSVVDTDQYLLACCRYIDLNPVRAGLVRRPEDYRWSSYRCRAGFEKDDLVDEDPFFKYRHKTAERRETVYRQYVEVQPMESEWKLIRNSLRRGLVTGNQDFAENIFSKTGVRVAPRRRGRPSASNGEKMGSDPF